MQSRESSVLLGHTFGRRRIFDTIELFPGTDMSDKERLKQIVIEKSLKVGDFTLASGQRSNYYIDAKLTSLDPEGLARIAAVFWEKLAELPVFPRAIGGLSTGADPIVAGLVALSFKNPGKELHGFYVRREVKGHGTKKEIEGYVGSPGDPVVIVDDVCTTGSSAIRAIEAAKTRRWNVLATICLVDRDEEARAHIEVENSVPYYPIFTASELLAELEANPKKAAR
ncbi:MAG: orotate phosphoribosyltransferase [Acidobacteria bacterium]|nr:orotate phosphoribosyltransferase [Acidobacteriota bacterium]